jgi:hypothetical protein
MRMVGRGNATWLALSEPTLPSRTLLLILPAQAICGRLSG